MPPDISRDSASTHGGSAPWKWKLTTCTVALVVLVAGAYAFGVQAYRKANPESAFSALVGKQLPDSVRVIQYASGVSDNFFRRSHYLLLEGDLDALRKLGEDANFERSDEYAAWQLPDAGAALGMTLTPSDLLEGYESRRARHRWILLVKEQKRAIYVL